MDYEKVTNDIQKDLQFSDVTATDLQDNLIDPVIIKEYRKTVSKRMNEKTYMVGIWGYTDSIFQDFQSYLRTKVDLVEEDFRLLLYYYNSNFITFESPPGIYAFKVLSEVPSRDLQID